MAKSFSSAAAFRMSLEERLRQAATQRGIPINSLRLKVVMERLLARLFADDKSPWLLKGGYAMELRYRPRARATKDIDLAVSAGEFKAVSQIEAIRDEIQQAADRDLGDFLFFQIGRASTELQGAPDGGARYPVTALIAGRPFASFHLDVGIGDPVIQTPEELLGEDFLGFAGLPPARVRAISRAQQFAEKLHAYTFPWNDRPNTRTKDLVDLVLLITSRSLESAAVRSAVDATFQARNTHQLPTHLPEPPISWASSFHEMAIEVQLTSVNLMDAFGIVDTYCRKDFT